MASPAVSDQGRAAGAGCQGARRRSDARRRDPDSPRRGRRRPPLSERLDRIIEQKRAGTLAGIALLKELEELTAEVVEVVQEANRPVVETIGQEVEKRVEGVSPEVAKDVAEAIVARADALCFANWWTQPHMDTELYREFTIVLVDRFKDLNLHGQGKDFVDRCIRLLKKVRFVGEAEA